MVLYSLTSDIVCELLLFTFHKMVEKGLSEVNCSASLYL